MKTDKIPRAARLVAGLVAGLATACPRPAEPPHVPAATSPDGSGTTVEPMRDAAGPPTTDAPELVFGEPVVVATGTRQQAGPAVAPGAVVYRRATGPSVGTPPSGSGSVLATGTVMEGPGEERVWQRLDDEGRAEGDPVALGTLWVSPGGLVRRNDHYLLATSGSTVSLLDLGPDGQEARRLNLEAEQITDEASVTVIGSQALVVWWNQDADAVHGCWVDLDAWSRGQPFEVQGAAGRSQYPVAAATSEGVELAWGEFADGSMATWSTLVSPGEPAGSATVLAPPAAPYAGPCVPVGWLSAARDALVTACGAMEKLVAVSTAGPLTTVSEAMLSGATTSVAGRGAVALEVDQQIRLWLVSAGGAAVGEARTLSESGFRNRHPSVASDGASIWVAWERFDEGMGGADVVVVVGRAP